MHGTREAERERMYKRIENHGHLLIDFFDLCPKHTDPISLCKRLRRLEREGERLGLALCSDEHFCDSHTEDEIKAIADSILQRVADVLSLSHEDLYGKEQTIILNRDPRGYALKMSEAASRDWRGYKDFGGYGILAPKFNGKATAATELVEALEEVFHSWSRRTGLEGSESERGINMTIIETLTEIRDKILRREMAADQMAKQATEYRPIYEAEQNALITCLGYVQAALDKEKKKEREGAGL